MRYSAAPLHPRWMVALPMIDAGKLVFVGKQLAVPESANAVDFTMKGDAKVSAASAADFLSASRRSTVTTPQSGGLRYSQEMLKRTVSRRSDRGAVRGNVVRGCVRRPRD